MAKIRAYKLAEELGIDRNDFVEQARQHGIDLKSAMASLDEGEVEALRDKFGVGEKEKRSVDERRLEGKSGTTVVRRRRKKAPEPVPEPEPEPVPEVVEEAPEPVVEETPVVEVEEPLAAEAEQAVAAEGHLTVKV